MPSNAFDANTLFNSNSLNPRAAGPAVVVTEQPRLRRKVIRNPAVSSVPAKEAINGPLGRALATGQVSDDLPIGYLPHGYVKVGGLMPGNTPVDTGMVHSPVSRELAINAAFDRQNAQYAAPRVLSHEETLLALRNAGKSRFDEGSHADIMPGGTAIVGHRLIGPGAADPAVMSPRSIGTAGESARQLAAIQRNNASMEEARNLGDGFGQQVARQERQKEKAQAIIHARAMEQAAVRGARLNGQDPLMVSMMGNSGGDRSMAVLARFGTKALEAYQRGQLAQSELGLRRDQLASQQTQAELQRQHEAKLAKDRATAEAQLAADDRKLKLDLQQQVAAGNLSLAQAQNAYQTQRDALTRTHEEKLKGMELEAQGTLADRVALANAEGGHPEEISDEQRKRLGMKPMAGGTYLTAYKQAKEAGLADPETYAHTETLKGAKTLDTDARRAMEYFYNHTKSTWGKTDYKDFLDVAGGVAGEKGKALAKEWYTERFG